MQGKHLFEYAMIRLVPRVEREEFVNVGVVICCKRQNFIRCQIHLNEQKVLMLDPEADFDLFRSYLHSFEKNLQRRKSGESDCASGCGIKISLADRRAKFYASDFPSAFWIYIGFGRILVSLMKEYVL